MDVRFFLTDTPYSGKLNGHNGDVTITSGSTTICFMAGTLIGSPAGEVPVETLTRGDQVLTQDGGVATVDWLGIQTVSTRFADKMRVLPIRIKAGALAEGVPSRDLLISPDHAVLVDGALIQASALVNGTSIVREHNVPTTFAYYHVEVEDHSLILAESTPAETFVDNIERLHFDNWAEHEALYPNGKSVRELPYPRAKSQRQVPVRTRIMLAARVQAIGASQTAVEVASGFVEASRLIETRRPLSDPSVQRAISFSPTSSGRRSERGPEKWRPVFRKRSRSNQELEREDDSKKKPSRSRRA